MKGNIITNCCGIKLFLVVGVRLFTTVGAFRSLVECGKTSKSVALLWLQPSLLRHGVVTCPLYLHRWRKSAYLVVSCEYCASYSRPWLL